MTANGLDIVDTLRLELGLSVMLDETGRPRLNEGVERPRWPGKLDPSKTVVMDTSPTQDGEFWPAPRFEILIANLDSVGIKVVQVGDPASERLARADHVFRKLNASERAGVISEALLWIGMNTSWRYIAAALNKPQVVIVSSRDDVKPSWNDTFIVDAASHKAESKTLGPISVTSVAEAATKALKQLGIAAQL